ncbi:MAG: hypothetical protein F6K63_29895 [Moorea sp. SIO1G6]|uniref:hypothetical protein n=1 Tax=Moorena sp. SIO1G6 TaxID=2607840 RepID=UPI0013C228D3|nr:hypothetical protein [Moorena sp. SIO1G6]NET68383.1 hypothetical protein [Moorena sp. SIO1G6]
MKRSVDIKKLLDLLAQEYGTPSFVISRVKAVFSHYRLTPLVAINEFGVAMFFVQKFSMPQNEAIELAEYLIETATKCLALMEEEAAIKKVSTGDKGTPWYYSPLSGSPVQRDDEYGYNWLKLIDKPTHRACLWALKENNGLHPGNSRAGAQFLLEFSQIWRDLMSGYLEAIEAFNSSEPTLKKPDYDVANIAIYVPEGDALDNE